MPKTKNMPMRNRKRNLISYFHLLSVLHTVLDSRQSLQACHQLNEILATSAISFGVNLHAIALASAVTADVSSREFIAYHLSVEYE